MKSYGYGIVDREGKPFWDEGCVCQDREPLMDTCDDLNHSSWHSDEDEARRPYRVVALWIKVRKP